MINPMTDARKWSIALVISTIVLLFRIAAWLSPSRFVVIPPSVAVPVNGLGLLFLMCGVWAC